MPWEHKGPLKVHRVKPTKDRPWKWEVWEGKIMVDCFGDKEGLLQQAKHYGWKLHWPSHTR